MTCILQNLFCSGELSNPDDDDEYTTACVVLKNNSLSCTVANVKVVVQKVFSKLKS